MLKLYTCIHYKKIFLGLGKILLDLSETVPLKGQNIHSILKLREKESIEKYYFQSHYLVIHGEN